MGGGGSAPQLNQGQIQQNQSGQNIATATAQQLLNQSNQTTPYGSLKYNQIGSTDVGGVSVPQFEAIQTLSPDQQQIYEKSTGVTNQALDLAPTLLKNVGNTVGTPLGFDGEGARNRAYDALMSRGRDEISRARGQGETQAANQGIAPGSEAWRRQTEGFDRSLVDLSNQATIGASGLAGQDLAQTLSIRNQPINELAALLGLSGGVSQPNYVNTPNAQVPATDTVSPALANYQGQMQQYQAGVSQQNALMGGLFGLGGAALGGFARNPGLSGLGR